MDAEASPSRSISTHLRAALAAWRGACVHAARLARDIPLPTRRGGRGGSRRYTQSGALARAIERQSGVKVTSEALRRVRPTEQQIGLSRSQRASNVQGAFKVAADRTADIHGRRIVLIDDVLTSGATADACARALLRAKAAQVDVLVVARVVDTYKAPI